ncbi:MAG: hypothetical protein K6A43_11400 [Treponema sp.]|nr:hypothetical protein [Treponema sp.]
MEVFTDIISPLVQILLSVVACYLAWYIPNKLSWEQRYSQLLADYRGYDFGAAVMGITMFFNKCCNNDVGLIEKEYREIFQAQFKNQWIPNKDKYMPEVPNDQNLHFQRRLLTQFYWDLDQCTKSIFIGKKRIQRDFSSKESNLLKVLYYMNEASQEEGIFIDITTDDRLTPNAKSINKYIKHIYNILKDAKPYVR